ncbi:MAG: hypothetical protein M0Q95_06560 [Porticoccaceae bacterium]|jgi:hypothetical protein|nr:hypothetical protein [Porticoccaceae bacterium]
MTDRNPKKPNPQFFLLYLNEKFKVLDEFFPLSHLCGIAGLSKNSFLEEAKRRNIEVWFKPPEDADIRLFPIRDVLLSQIKSELDYLSVLSGDAFGSLGILIPDTHVLVSVGVPMDMDYLLISFQDLRWHTSNQLCIFMEGVRKEDNKYLQGNGGEGSESSQYRHYKFVQNDDSLPKVFITCEKQKEKPDRPITLDEERVRRIEVNKMNLYVEKTKLLVLGYRKALISEMEEFKSYLLRLMDLEAMPFLDFPEKLFYIFVITCRNLDRAKLGERVNRKLVVEELVIVGFGKKLAEDIATLIVNTKSSSGKRKRFLKRAGISDDDQLRSLNIMSLFKAFAEHYKAGRDFEANEILRSLTVDFGYPDEAARKLSPLVAGTDDSESWKGYPLNIS